MTGCASARECKHVHEWQYAPLSMGLSVADNSHSLVGRLRDLATRRKFGHRWVQRTPARSPVNLARQLDPRASALRAIRAPAGAPLRAVARGI